MKKLKSQIIVFCGAISESIVTEHTQTNFAKPQSSTLDVYSTFAFDKAADQIDTSLVRFLKKDYSTQLYGHSLGAALAMLFTLHLQSEGFKVEKLITFGQPKIIREKESSMYKTIPAVRIVDFLDPVPLLFSGYVHTGPEVILFPEQHYSNLKEHQEDILAETRFDCNHIESYLRNLKAKQRAAVSIPWEDRNTIIRKQSSSK